MKRCAPRTALAILLLAAGCTAPSSDERTARPEPATPGDLVISDVWCRPTPARATAGAIYLTLLSPRGDQLLGVVVPDSVAGTAEVHEVVKEAEGRVRMQATAAVGLPAGETVEFRPGAWHVMLLDLRRPLVAGDTVHAVLRFEKAGERAVDAVVRQP